MWRAKNKLEVVCIVVDLIPNIECKCSYDLNPNPTSFSEKWKVERQKKLCMQKGYRTFESIKQRQKSLRSIRISTFILQITKNDSKYMTNCVHTCGI